MDDANNITLLDSGLAAEISLNGERAPLCCNWTAGILRYDDQSQKVTAEISKNFESKPVYTMKNIRTMENLELHVQHINTKQLIKQYPVSGIRPLQLIGQNNCALIVYILIFVFVCYFSSVFFVYF
jgi:hypothetical protein